MTDAIKITTGTAIIEAMDVLYQSDRALIVELTCREKHPDIIGYEGAAVHLDANGQWDPGEMPTEIQPNGEWEGATVFAEVSKYTVHIAWAKGGA